MHHAGRREASRRIKETDTDADADIERDLVSTSYEEILTVVSDLQILAQFCPFPLRSLCFFFLQGFTESLPWNHARVETQQRRSLFFFSQVG